MSNAPREARSFEKIEIDHLNHLANLAFRKINEAFDRAPKKRFLYEDYLLGICLCQGGADHLLHSAPLTGRGIHDFDLWAFYANRGAKSFWNRAAGTADFGPSIFGRSPLDGPRYIGRRVDVFWRTINVNVGQTAVEAIRTYFAFHHSDSACALREKSAVLIWPRDNAGLIIWEPAKPIPKTSLITQLL